MKALYDQLSEDVSKLTTRSYSTSFSLGILALNKRHRKDIYAIYGFVRLADEIVDSFAGYDQAYLLSKFRSETYEALENKISLNPILNTFQHCVNNYGIDRKLIDTFLDSMEMDLTKIQYNRENYEQYILGSAEVVGLMCLYVFTNGNLEMYENLKFHAMKLGAAFQKVNFLRDIRDDYHGLGRVYFPNVDMNVFDSEVKKSIELEIEKDFQQALEGIKKLPAASKGGVYLAYVYYKALFNKIKKLPAHRILNERIRIPNTQKFGLMMNSMVQHKLNWI